MRKCFSLWYLGLGILAMTLWHHLPHLSHGCHEKHCTVFSKQREVEKGLISKEPIVGVLSERRHVLPLTATVEEKKEETKELFRITLCQARAPPYGAILNM